MFSARPSKPPSFGGPAGKSRPSQTAAVASDADAHAPDAQARQAARQPWNAYVASDPTTQHRAGVQRLTQKQPFDGSPRLCHAPSSAHDAALFPQLAGQPSKPRRPSSALATQRSGVSFATQAQSLCGAPLLCHDALSAQELWASAA